MTDAMERQRALAYFKARIRDGRLRPPDTSIYWILTANGDYAVLHSERVAAQIISTTVMTYGGVLKSNGVYQPFYGRRYELLFPQETEFFLIDYVTALRVRRAQRRDATRTPHDADH